MMLMTYPFHPYSSNPWLRTPSSTESGLQSQVVKFGFPVLKLRGKFASWFKTLEFRSLINRVMALGSATWWRVSPCGLRPKELSPWFEKACGPRRSCAGRLVVEHDRFRSACGCGRG